MSVIGGIKKFLRNQKVGALLKNSEIGITTNLVLFNVKRNNKSIEKYYDLETKFIESSNNIRGTIGQRFISIMVNEKYKDYLTNVFNEYIVSIQKNIACIIINCPKTDKVLGVVTYISLIISQKNINMYGFFTSQDDIILIIDGDNAYKHVDEIKNRLKV